MTTPDMSAALEAVARSKETVRTSLDICDASQESLMHGHRALAATRTNLAEMQAALAAFRQDLP